MTAPPDVDMPCPLTPTASSPRICVLGAAPDTGNLGVSALGVSIVHAIHTRLPDARITVMDHGSSVRPGSIGGIPCTRCGAVSTRRFWRSNSIARAYLTSRLNASNEIPLLEQLTNADLVLDISGGDSFTDMYGRRRFEAMTRLKRLVLSNGTPLVLLPQTYGPFKRSSSARMAASIVRDASMAWARDAASFAAMRTLLGEDFDVARHRPGVDVAFALPARTPCLDQATEWLMRDWFSSVAPPVIGLNVSGLLYSDPAMAARRFGLRGDYRELIHGLVTSLLKTTDANILLVPHVNGAPGTPESDVSACLATWSAMGQQTRVAVLPQQDDASRIKWFIRRCDWFCGTRMHATIAALSSGVPAAAIAYSPKTHGVFQTVGVEDHVADFRSTSTAEVIDLLLKSWTDHDDVRSLLAHTVPRVASASDSQFDAILASVMPAGDQPVTGRLAA